MRYLGIAVIGMSLTWTGAYGAVSAPSGSPKFLTLPYTDEDVRVTTGWYYDRNLPPQYDFPSCADGNDLPDSRRHCGIDFGNGGETFEVVAAADGQAKGANSEGDAGRYVVIKHNVSDPNGRPFYTRYLHLASFLGPVSEGQWTSIKRGEPIGMAGNSGVPEEAIHLHFSTFIGSQSPSDADAVDPYDIAEGLLVQNIWPSDEHYPDNKTNNAQVEICGLNNVWMTCPPRPPKCTNVYSSSSSIPQSYGAAYDVLDSKPNLILRTTCGVGDAVFSVGDGVLVDGRPRQLIYERGYEYAGPSKGWQVINFVGRKRFSGGGPWYEGEVVYDKLTQFREATYVVAYVCTWTGAEWKCGCRNKACAQSFWQLQAFRRK
jgi:hypothetical protein